MSGSTGFIREELGRLGAKTDAAAELLRELRAEIKASREEAQQERERIWVEIRTVKHDHRTEMQVLSLRTERLELSTEALRLDVGASIAKQENATKSLREEMTKKFDQIEAPLRAAVSFNSRIAGIGAAITAVALALWASRDSIVSMFVWLSRSLSKQ